MSYMSYRSIPDLNDCILKHLSIFPRTIDLIVGIPRSGMLPANLLALYLNKPYTDIDSFVEGHIYTTGARGRDLLDKYNHILVVDDSLRSGSALKKAKEKLKNFESQYEIKYGVVYGTSSSQYLVDYFCEIIDGPRIFQWNIFHHGFLMKACCDIDGVLCPDPPVDDDGSLYLDYISNAPALYIPTVEIHTLVSCRLEKYRSVTEEWLNKNGVRYKQLVMLDLPNKEARIKWNRHGEYKAEIYGRGNYSLFIESSLRQAKIIARRTLRPVFCTENFMMIQSQENIQKGKMHIRLFLSRHIPIGIKNWIKKKFDNNIS